MNRSIIFLISIILLQGCASSGYKDFYVQVAPTKYVPPEKTAVFEYANVDLKEIYSLIFSDFLIIGTSRFNGPYENPVRAESFATSIGADVFIASSQFKETRTSFMNVSTPTSNTTHVSGYSGVGSFYGTATTYGTQTTTIPLRFDRYDQDGVFLKNINNVVPLWDRTEDQYKKTEPSDLEATWFNENYKIHIYKSGQQITAFISDAPRDRSKWSRGQLKFIYGADSGVGIYLTGDKTPMPAKFKLNKFGHLEVTIIASDESFSFSR